MPINGIGQSSYKVARMSRSRFLLAAFILGLPLLSTGVYFFPRTSHGTSSAARTAKCVAEPIRDLGNTTLEKQWKIVFPIRNDGARRLVLNELEHECNCKDHARRVILVRPGATAEVTVTLDTRFASGPIEATTSFATNDPARPSLNLTVRACVDVAEAPRRSGADDDAQSSILIRR